MGDHPDGNLIANGAYGLRLDQFKTLWSGGDNILVTSAANVVISFDPNDLAAGATVTGTIQTSYRAPGNTFIANDLWTLNYTLDGLEAYNGGFAAKSGLGSIVDIDGSDIDNGFDGPINLMGKADDSGFVFLFAPDGHRLEDFGSEYGADTWVARGWVTGYRYEYEWQKVWDANGRCWKYLKVKVIKMKSWDGTNDFLMVSGTGSDVPPVPEPSTMLLTMGGVALLWFRKRRS